MRRPFFAGLMLLSVFGVEPAAVRGQTTTAQAAIDALYPEMAALYQDLHRNPELAFQETRTLKDGLFTRFPKPDFVLGLHDDDTLPAGTVGYHAGFFRASMTAPVITIVGRGGHGAVPHNTVDPIVIAARTIMGLQTIVSRENNPLEPLVVTVGSIHGGTQGNIIPDQVRMELSVRTFSEEVRKRVVSSIERMARAEAMAAGAPREPTIEFANAGIGPVPLPTLRSGCPSSSQRSRGRYRRRPPRWSS